MPKSRSSADPTIGSAVTVGAPRVLRGSVNEKGGVKVFSLQKNLTVSSIASFLKSFSSEDVFTFLQISVRESQENISSRSDVSLGNVVLNLAMKLLVA